MKKNSRKIRLICFLFLFVFAIALFFKSTTNKVQYTSFYNYVVEKNDTLWNIANVFNFNSQDVRCVVRDIQAKNNIGSIIVPGQLILIPYDAVAMKQKQQHNHLIVIDE